MQNLGTRRFGKELQNIIPLNNENSQKPLSQLKIKKMPYMDQILAHLLQQESKYVFQSTQIQTQINDNMRAILIDWLSLLANTLNLRKETLYLTCHIIDKYSSQVKILKNEFQLLGVTSMFIACKLEEIHPPTIKDFCYVTKNSNLNIQVYKDQQIVQLESQIIVILDFNLNFPNPIIFLDYFQEKMHLDKKIFYLSQYLLELSLLDKRFTQFNPSLLATSSIFLSKKQIHKFRLLNQNQTSYIYTEIEIYPCAKLLCCLVYNAENLKYQTIRQKYAQETYLGVSSFKMQLI